MSQFVEIRTALPLREDAQRIAQAIVDKRLAASTQVSGPIESRYWWQGTIATAEEWVVTAKTRLALYKNVEQTIRCLHPYGEPGIVAVSFVAGSESYFDWIEKETEQEPQTRATQMALTKEQLIQAFDDAYQRLISAARKATERIHQHSQGDEWEPREVLAHIAGWAAQATAQLPGVIAGIPPIAYDSDRQHAALDDFANKAFIALIGDQTFDQVVKIADQTHLRFIQMLKQQDKSIFAPGNYVYERMLRVIDHHLDHAQELETGS